MTGHTRCNQHVLCVYDLSVSTMSRSHREGMSNIWDDTRFAVGRVCSSYVRFITILFCCTTARVGRRLHFKFKMNERLIFRWRFDWKFRKSRHEKTALILLVQFWLPNENHIQECNPVGCVPPAAMAVSPAIHSPTTYAPRHAHTPPAMHASPPPWTEFLTHACENITLLQPHCGR